MGPGSGLEAGEEDCSLPGLAAVRGGYRLTGARAKPGEISSASTLAGASNSANQVVPGSAPNESVSLAVSSSS